MNPRSTVYGDLKQRAVAVYRVVTQASTYTVAFHDARGRRFVVVRSESAGREATLLRDSDPRVGEHSLFEVAPASWVGQCLEIATMTTSPIQTVIGETDPALLAAVGHFGAAPASTPERSPWARPAGAAASAPAPSAPRDDRTSVDRLAGDRVADDRAPDDAGSSGALSSSPRIVPFGARGTLPGESSPAMAAAAARHLVVGGAAAALPARVAPPGPAVEPEIPYPLRHVQYAESMVQLLRSISRRERIFEDLGASPQLRARMRHALDESASLLEQIRRRDRT